MVDEVLDLVNENDEVIGTVPRSIANSNNKVIHREVAILIYDEQNRILIQQRSELKKSNPLLWIISVAGHVSAGIDPLDMAHQELREEVGFDTDLVFIQKFLETTPTQKRFNYFYKGKVKNGTKITLDPSESKQASFLSEKELDHLIVSGEKIEKWSLQAFRDFWAGKL